MTPYAQYDLQGNYIQTFAGCLEAAKAVNGSHSNICRVQGKGLSSSGFLWLKIDGTPPLNIASKYDEKGALIFTDERRARISALNMGKFLGKKVSAETRRKQRLARLGKPPVNKGVPATPEQRKKNSETSPNKKPVSQLDLSGNLIKQWDSIKEASIATGTTRAGILKVVKGESRHANGYKWERPNL